MADEASKENVNPAKIKGAGTPHKPKADPQKVKEKKILINQLPFQLFLQVAAADEAIDHKELELFQKLIKKQNSNSPHAQKLFQTTQLEYEQLLKGYNKGLIKREIERVEGAVELIHRLLPPFDAKLFIDDMYSFCERIAKASGGFIGLGSVGKEEKAILASLKAVFDRSVALPSPPKTPEPPKSVPPKPAPGQKPAEAKPASPSKPTTEAKPSSPSKPPAAEKASGGTKSPPPKK